MGSMPNAALNEAEKVEQPKTIVTHRRLEVNPKAFAAWMRRLSGKHSHRRAMRHKTAGHDVQLTKLLDRCPTAKAIRHGCRTLRLCVVVRRVVSVLRERSIAKAAIAVSDYADNLC